MEPTAYFKAYRNTDGYIAIGFIEYELTLNENVNGQFFTSDRPSFDQKRLEKVFQAIHIESGETCIVIRDKYSVVFLTQTQYGCELIQTYDVGSKFKYVETIDVKIVNEMILSSDGNPYPHYETQIRSAVTELIMRTRKGVDENPSVINSLIQQARPLTAGDIAYSAAHVVRTTAIPMIIYAVGEAQSVAIKAAGAVSEYVASTNR